jgi:hypothetical protein
MLLFRTSPQPGETTSHLPSWTRLTPAARKRLLLLLMALAVAFSVRVLTLQFMRAHLNDAGWFQYGSYRIFDQRARDILDGRGHLFWIHDSSRTDLIQYPPAFPWLVAAIYSLTNDRSAYAVQNVQWILDLILTMGLCTGIAVTAYGWRVGIATSFLVGLSPLLALYGVSPTADPPTTWLVLGGLWFLLLAGRRNSVWWALGSGLMLGAACWLRVNPLYLSLFWAIALLLFVRSPLRQRGKMSGALVLGAALVISPIVIRNYVVFPDFTPTGGTVGANLWEGLGETEFGRRHGFIFGDDLMVERERIKMGLPPDFPMQAMWPDGIKREKERTREALDFIKRHPVWYGGVMLHRMWGMLKVVGAPLPYYGSSGFNVTTEKTLPPNRRGGLLAFLVNLLGMIQSLTRSLLLPLTAMGVVLAARHDWLMTSLLLATVFYYLVPGTAAHTEIRYVLPLHCVLPIFAGFTVARCVEFIFSHQHPAFGKANELKASS